MVGSGPPSHHPVTPPSHLFECVRHLGNSRFHHRIRLRGRSYRDRVEIEFEIEVGDAVGSERMVGCGEVVVECGEGMVECGEAQ